MIKKQIVLIPLLLYLIACGKEKDVYVPCEEKVYDQNAEIALYDGSAPLAYTEERQYNCLKAPDVIDLAEARVAYSIALSNIKRNQAFVFHGYGEVTNPTAKPMMIAWFFVLSDSPYSIKGEEITDRKGYNITAEMHHGVYGQSGNLVFDSNFDGYLNLVVYAASGEKRLENEHLIIENFGEMSIMRVK